MHRGNGKHKNIMTQKGTSSWKNVAFILRYTIIYIIIFASFLIIPCIHSILFGLERKQLEDGNGNISKVQNEMGKEKKNIFERFRNVKSKELELEQTLFKDKQDRLEEKIQDMSDKLKKYEDEIEKYKDDLETIKERSESLEQQLKSEKELRMSLMQLSENKIKNLEKMASQRLKTLTKETREIKNKHSHLNKRVSNGESNDKMHSKNYAELSVKVSETNNQMKNQEEKFNKESKINKDRNDNFTNVDILLISLIIILLLSNIKTNWTVNSLKQHEDLKRLNPILRQDKAIISFSGDCRNSHMELAKEFIDPCNSFVINDNKDIRQLHTIHAKVFIVFIDFNERNIILEGDMEPVKIRKETVEYIMKTGGTPVVIYCKHMGSRTLEDRCLYSRKLTSIQYHSTLKKLALQDCVLSIDQQFSEYQISHLKNICNNP